MSDLYREAVVSFSPGLPRCAATLGPNGRSLSTPTGLRLNGEIGVYQSILWAIFETTQPRWGWISLDPFTQGSRKARQPWAGLHNRFAVQIQSLN